MAPLRVTLVACLLLAAALGEVWACPSWRFSGARIDLPAPVLAEGWSMSIRSGGDYRLKTCNILLALGGGLQGYATAPPHVSAQVGPLDGRDLVLHLDSDCPTHLLVNMPNQTFAFAPHRQGGATLTLRRARQGLYDIWLAAATPGGCSTTLHAFSRQPSITEDFVESLRRVR